MTILNQFLTRCRQTATFGLGLAYETQNVSLSGYVLKPIVINKIILISCYGMIFA